MCLFVAKKYGHFFPVIIFNELRGIVPCSLFAMFLKKCPGEAGLEWTMTRCGISSVCESSKPVQENNCFSGQIEGYLCCKLFC